MIDAISRAFTKTPTSPAEFDRLMNESHRKVYALALRLAGNPTDAEDLCQESYIRAYRFFHRYDAELSFTAWMYRILTNVHIDFRRRKGRVRTTSFDTTNQNGQTWDFADSTTSPATGASNRSLSSPLIRRTTTSRRSAKSSVPVVPAVTVVSCPSSWKVTWDNCAETSDTMLLQTK